MRTHRQPPPPAREARPQGPEDMTACLTLALSFVPPAPLPSSWRAETFSELDSFRFGATGPGRFTFRPQAARAASNSGTNFASPSIETIPGGCCSGSPASQPGGTRKSRLAAAGPPPRLLLCAARPLHFPSPSSPGPGFSGAAEQ
jgi:hypothetical protein